MDEKKKILEMVKKGKISVDEAERLLNALGADGEGDKAKQAVMSSSGKGLKGKLRIEIDSNDGDKVRIAVPLKLASMIKGMIPKQATAQMNAEGIDLNVLLESLDEGLDTIDEDLVNIESSDGDTVRIFVDKQKS
jgi:polyhydroxyalkanoate synthesis regulator phasin